MAIQTVALDPNAQAYTDDEIVGKVNTAAAVINRANSVDPAARPIAAGEVDATELAAGAVDNSKLAATAAKDNLDAQSDTTRGYVKSAPTTGEFPVTAVKRDSAGKFAFDYDDVPVA